MKNSATKRFESKAASILAEQKNRILKEVAAHIEAFATIEFIKFTNEKPYAGETKNKIFFLTRSELLMSWMTVGQLDTPHGRGYLKGVATDLDGYLKLRAAKMLYHDFDYVAPIYLPKFRKSQNRGKYLETCTNILNASLDELNEFILVQKKVLNGKLNEMTGCSLLFYLRDI